MSRAFVNLPDNATGAEGKANAVADNASLHDKVIAALRGIHDPEIPVNIYDLGLIYKLDIRDRDVDIEMTLTTPHCPVADAMPAEVERAIREIDGVGEVKVRLTWDPPWTADRLTDEVKLTLGLL